MAPRVIPGEGPPPIVDEEPSQITEADEEAPLIGDEQTAEISYEPACSICDYGGELLICGGICKRSFHPVRVEDEGLQVFCPGISVENYKALRNFTCKNCQYRLHQCFLCRQLGTSDESLGAEVFQCKEETCGYFYHPHCVAKLLHQGEEIVAKELQDQILAGGSFTCSLHACFGCGDPEDKEDPGLRMAVCRRCPTAYHEKCLPDEIAFEDRHEEGLIQRAWRGVLLDHTMIYCLTEVMKLQTSGRTPRQYEATNLLPVGFAYVFSCMLCSIYGMLVAISKSSPEYVVGGVLS